MKRILIIVIGVIAVSTLLLSCGKKEGEPEVTLYNYAIKDAFIANVNNSEKLVKVSIVLVVNKDITADLEENIYIIRDTILIMLRSLTDEDISSPDIMEKLRSEIPAALNEALEIDNVVSVYFTDFVMQ
jgi:flagellar basal body-associated protein FliL